MGWFKQDRFCGQATIISWVAQQFQRRPHGLKLAKNGLVTTILHGDASDGCKSYSSLKMPRIDVTLADINLESTSHQILLCMLTIPNIF
jgi:hypothetical protein